MSHYRRVKEITLSDGKKLEYRYVRIFPSKKERRLQRMFDAALKEALGISELIRCYGEVEEDTHDAV